MQLTAKKLSELINGTLEGNADTFVDKLAKIEEAESNAISFIANPKYIPYLKTTRAGILVVSKDLQYDSTNVPAIIRVADPYSAFQQLLSLFTAQEQEVIGIHELAFVASDAQLADGVSVGPYTCIASRTKIGQNTIIYAHVYIGKDVVLGSNVVIYSGVHIYAGTTIGDNCIIHAGTIIGSDGFGFAPQPDGTFKKVPQTGVVFIGNNVEIGANCTIDRATMGATVLHDGVKIDNLVHIAHNAEIGKNTVIAAQTGVSGSTKLGNNCIVGGQVGFVGHLSIAPGTQINAQSGIAKSIKEPNRKWNGSPAFDYNDSMRSLVVLRQLPDLQRQVSELKKQIEELNKIINKN